MSLQALLLTKSIAQLQSELGRAGQFRRVLGLWQLTARDAGPLRDDPVLSERTLRVLRCGWLQRRPEPLLLTRSLTRGRNHANARHVHLIECNADLI